MGLEPLATGLVRMYSPAHGNGTERAGPIFSDRYHHDAAAMWHMDLCQSPGDETGHAYAACGRRTIYRACSWCQGSLPRWVLQWVDQRSGADEGRG